MRVSQLLGLLLCGLLLASCNLKNKDDHPEGSVQVRIPLLVNGEYQMQVVNLQSVDDMQELKGAVANFLIAPRIDGGKLIGLAPKIHSMRNSSGIYVATDAFSLELLTIYYHTEQMAIMDERLGAKDLNTWPRSIGVNVNFSDQGELVQDNAMFSGDLDAMLIVPYRRADNLPIAVNGGILAHEHFHSLFHKLVTLKLTEKFSKMNLSAHSKKNFLDLMGLESLPLPPPDYELNSASEDYYHLYLLRGLNEGLADFWSWLYTQDDQFVSRSLPEHFEARRLDKSSLSVPAATCFRMRLNSKDQRVSSGAAYHFGTQFARSLREMALKSGKTPTEIESVYGKAILRSLPQLVDGILALKKEEIFEPRLFLEILKKEMASQSEEELKFLDRVIQASARGTCL